MGGGGFQPDHPVIGGSGKLKYSGGGGGTDTQTPPPLDTALCCRHDPVSNCETGMRGMVTCMPTVTYIV